MSICYRAETIENPTFYMVSALYSEAKMLPIRYLYKKTHIISEGFFLTFTGNKAEGSNCKSFNLIPMQFEKILKLLYQKNSLYGKKNKNFRTFCQCPQNVKNVEISTKNRPSKLTSNAFLFSFDSFIPLKNNKK